MPVQTVRTRLGSDVALWCQMLGEAKAARSVVENSSREKAFGPVIVDYSSVQAKVSFMTHISVGVKYPNPKLWDSFQDDHHDQSII